MRVVIIGTRGFPNVQGGVERHCQELAVHLAALGVEVIVFTRKPYVDASLCHYRDVTLEALPTVRHKYLETPIHTFFAVIASLRYNPDILHIQSIGPSFFTPLARLFGIKAVVTSHGRNYEHLKWGPVARCLLRCGEWCGVTFASALIAISEEIAEQIMRHYRRAATVIPNGVTAPPPSNGDAALRQHGLTAGRYVISVGRLVPEKGYEVLIDAFAEALKNDPTLLAEGWKLAIVGGADHKGRYEEGLHKRAAASERIVFTGRQDDGALNELYAHAALFALASRYEGMSIALLEARSHGLPCVVSDIPGNRAITLPEGCYFPVDDEEALRTKLAAAMRQPASAAQRAATRRATIAQYSWATVARQTLAVYTAVADKGTTRRC